MGIRCVGCSRPSAVYRHTHTHLALTVCIQLVNGMEMASVLVSSCVFFSSSSKCWNLFLFLAAPCRACRVSSSAMTRPTSTLLPSLVDNTHLSDPFFLSFILFIPSLLILPQSAPFFCLLPENIPTTDRMYQGKDIERKDYRRYSAVYPRPYMSVDAVSILPYICRRVD